MWPRGGDGGGDREDFANLLQGFKRVPNHVDIEGACEGSLACSTCHVVVETGWFDKLGPASDDEEDMLDLAFGLTHTSRLGCQIRITEALDGLVVKLPAATRNMMVDK